MEPNLTSDYEDEFDIKSQAAFSDLIRKPKITATGMNRCVLIRKVIKDDSLPKTSDLGDDPMEYSLAIAVSIPNFASIIKCGTSTGWIDP